MRIRQQFQPLIRIHLIEHFQVLASAYLIRNLTNRQFKSLGRSIGTHVHKIDSFFIS